jgi:hypothetical protein
MEPDIRWLEAVFGRPQPDSTGLTHVAVSEGARSKLQQMAGELVGTNRLVALYVPETTEEVWHPGDKRGRVVGAVQLVEMPSDKKIEDYFYLNWDKTPRWPIGWPARLVYAPPFDYCPALRGFVESEFGPGSFGAYVHRLELGPFPLEDWMREKLNHAFGQFPRLA